MHFNYKYIFTFSFLLLTYCSADVPVEGISKSSGKYCVKGSCYRPQQHYNYSEKGLASWYGPNFHGKKTASGNIYNQHHFTAAHRTLPLPSIARVVNLETGRSVVVVINDRGPFKSTIHKGCKHTYKKRIIDLSYAAAKEIGVLKKGVVPVHVETFPQESQEFACILRDLQQKYGKKNINFVKAFYKIYA